MKWSDTAASMHRYQWLVIGAALFIFALAFLVTSPVLEFFKPAIEDAPNFQAAMRSLEQEKPEQAMNALRKMRGEHPRSALLLFYQALALDAQQQQQQRTEAESFLSSALAIPGAESALIAWGKGHAEVVLFLEHIAEQMLEPALNDPRNQHPVIFRDSSGEIGTDWERLDVLATRALHISERINADSPKTQYLLAMIEGFGGDPRSAHRRLSRLIDSAKSAREPDFYAFFVYRTARASNAIRWSDSLRSGAFSRVAAEGALRLVQEADSDLRLCSRYLGDTYSADHPSKVQRIKEARLGAMLTMSETEIDLGHLAEARAHIRSVDRIVSGLLDDARSLGLNPPDTAPLTRRLREVERRVQ